MGMCEGLEIHKSKKEIFDQNLHGRCDQVIGYSILAFRWVMPFIRVFVKVLFAKPQK